MKKAEVIEKIQKFIMSLLSRKFLLALAGAYIAWEAGWSDGTMSQQELLIAISPILAFLGVEGYADAKREENR